MTSSMAGLRRSSKAFPKAKLTPRKIMVTVWWSAASLIHYSFLNPRETITYEQYAQHISKMHQKLQGLWPALVNRKGPILLHDDTWTQIAQPTFQTLSEWGYEVLLSPITFTWLLSNWLPLLQASWQLFVQKMLPHQEEVEKCFLRVRQIPNHGFLCYRNK